MILDHLSKENVTSFTALIVSREPYFTDSFKDSSILSTYQLAQGSSPSAFGLPASMILHEMLNAYIKVFAARAIKRTIKLKHPGVLSSTLMHGGIWLWIYFDASKQNDRKHRIEARVVGVHYHFARYSRHKNDVLPLVFNEHICIAQKDEVERGLTKLSMEKHILKDTKTTTGDDGIEKPHSTTLCKILDLSKSYGESKDLIAIEICTNSTTTYSFLQSDCIRKPRAGYRAYNVLHQCCWARTARVWEIEAQNALSYCA